MSESVLIVGDSLTVRMDLAEAFAEAGFRAISCATASAARQAAAKETVAAAILDGILPDGGAELIEELRAQPSGAHTVIVMLSTALEAKDRIRGLESGADEYLGKPYDAGSVVSRTRELLRARPATEAAGRPTVLLIDDNRTFRAALRAALIAAGSDVLVACSGEEGLRVAASQRPGAIIVDGQLPGMDGASFIRRIRLDAALRGTTCVLLTGSDGAKPELRALDAGADAFVRKDEDLAVILARLAAAVRAATGPRASIASSLLGPKRILAVDDDADYLASLGDALRSEGYDLVLARSGEEAIELLAVQSVDCILLDLTMPGLGGQETCQHLKTSPVVRDTPLIILTSRSDREAMIDSLGAGADDYIAKSGDLTVLKARVRAQIRRKQFEDEGRRIRGELMQKELEATEARAARELAETRAALVEELERKNEELEAFSYSVSHDLRAPLRSIDGFSAALLEDAGDQLDDSNRQHLHRVRAAAKRMSELIDDLLEFSRVGRLELKRTAVDVTSLVEVVVGELRRGDATRGVEVVIEPEMSAEADPRLLQVVFENLVGNAWKFTARAGAPRIEIGTTTRDGVRVFQIRDNGAGFDMAFAKRLFTPFQRLHAESEFPGTGIGLATIRRIVERHGGKTWAEGAVGVGAVLSFTLSPRKAT